MKKVTFLSLLLAAAFVVALASCSPQEKKNDPQQQPETTDSVFQVNDTVVTALVETQPVKSEGDAADDPALWINPNDPTKALIIGTDKRMGLCVYAPDGKELHSYPVGRANNVDLRYNFPLGDQKVDIVAASNRTHNTLTLMKIDRETGELKDIAARQLKSEITDGVYGLCMYQSPKTGKFYVFVNGKSGHVEQWELSATAENKIDGQIVRKLKVPTQVEGMVADDENATLYIGEEICCIRKYHAEPQGETSGKLIAQSDSTNTNIAYDIEGLSIFYAPGGKGYLIASSQGNFTYAVFERQGENKYLFSFSIAEGEIDGAQQTDGIDVTNRPFGTQFPYGMLVVQDGFNTENGDTIAQNFKLVSWEQIAKLTQPNLLINPDYQIER